jgi:flagellar biosynthetic protein FlhB
MSQGSGEKTEKASPKKKKDAREKGEVHKSADLASALMIFILFGALKTGYDGFAQSMEAFMATMLSPNIAERARDVTAASMVSTYRDVLFTVLPIILPLMLVAMVSGTIVHLVQVGPMFVPGKLKPDFSKINPFNGIKRIFSTSTLVELTKSIVKIVILAWIIYQYFVSGLKTYAQMIYVDVGHAFSQIMSACFSMGVMIGLALIAFAAVDVLYQWWKFEKDLRMTKQEVKEENKQTEGDPQIKGKIRQKQRKMSAMRMMQRVPEADVVVTNPTHFAVALRYKESEDKAPVVLAKGQDFLAQRIKALAKEHKISIVENKPVARALYAGCEVGDEIPPEMYQAIADILIYVYKTVKVK